MPLSVESRLTCDCQALVRNERLNSSNLRSIRSFLSANDYLQVHHHKLDGSCQWIDERQDYKDWRDATSELDLSEKYKPSVYWVTANPGAGKTMLVTHIESQLAELGLQHGVYYFNAGKTEFRSLAGLLRSIAYQMARSNAHIREKLMEIRNETSTLDLDDARAIWSNIFRTVILQVSFEATNLAHFMALPVSLTHFKNSSRFPFRHRNIGLSMLSTSVSHMRSSSCYSKGRPAHSRSRFSSPVGSSQICRSCFDSSMMSHCNWLRYLSKTP